MTIRAFLASLMLSSTFTFLEAMEQSTNITDYDDLSHRKSSIEASVIDDHFNDSCSLPWNVSRSAYRDVPDHLFHSLMQCPENLHGCSDELVVCRGENIYAITCSCATNCVVYGDCCWNVVELPETPIAELPRTSCVSVNAVPEPTESPFENSQRNTLFFGHDTFDMVHLRMVVGCPASWPDQDVRKACEKHESFEEVFYIIPVTTSRQVTYRNGFCALCNNETVDGAFWTTKLDGDEALLFPPETVYAEPTYHLRPCTDDIGIDTCSLEVSDVVSRGCKMYYAPVRESGDGKVYKNIYCATCNGADASKLSCEPPTYFDDQSQLDDFDTDINMAALFKAVTATPTCRAFYNGRCYIPRTSNAGNPQTIYNGDKDDLTKIGVPKLAREDRPPRVSGSRNYGPPSLLYVFTFRFGLYVFFFRA